MAVILTTVKQSSSRGFCYGYDLHAFRWVGGLIYFFLNFMVLHCLF